MCLADLYSYSPPPRFNTAAVTMAISHVKSPLYNIRSSRTPKSQTHHHPQLRKFSSQFDSVINQKSQLMYYWTRAIVRIEICWQKCHQNFVQVLRLNKMFSLHNLRVALAYQVTPALALPMKLNHTHHHIASIAPKQSVARLLKENINSQGKRREAGGVTEAVSCQH